MTTSTQALADDVHAAVPVITIEGIGNYAGLFRFVPRTLVYANGDPQYKPWIDPDSAPEPPDEEIPVMGGVVESSELEVEITDGQGNDAGGDYNALTALLKIDAPPDLFLSGALAVSAGPTTSIIVVGTAAKIARVTATVTVLYFGAEACRVEAVTASTATSKTCTVRRAQLDTLAQSHSDGSGVWIDALPFIEGRLIRYRVGFDTEGFSTGEELEVGPGWRVVDADLDETLGAWVFRGLSGFGLVDRSICKRRYSGLVLRARGQDENFLYLSLSERSHGTVAQNVAHFSDGVWLKHGDEIFFATPVPNQIGDITDWLLNVAQRGSVQTERATFDDEEEVAQVFVAFGGTGKSSFRFQERGTETSSIGSGTWINDTRCEHPIAGILCVLTSSATPDGSDGLQGTNFVANFGNFSSLPPGIGAGIPAALIDWQSFHDVWDRTKDIRLPRLMLDGATTARKWLEENICQLTGFAIIIRNGKIRCEYAAIPAAGTLASATWSHLDGLLTEEKEEGVEQSRLRYKRRSDIAASTIVYKTVSPTGKPRDIEINDGDYPELTGYIRGLFSQDTPPLEIQALAAVADSAGGQAVLEKNGIRLLSWFRKPPPELEAVTDLSFLNVLLANTVALTHYDIPNLRLGTRGQTNLLCWVRGKRISLRNSEIMWTLIAFGFGGKYGRVQPAAVINGAPSGNVATVHQNRYTDLNAGLGLATRDCLAFTPGDRYRLRALSGAIVASTPTFQTLLSINSGANQLTFDGNFGGAWASTQKIIPAAYDDQSTTQKSTYLSYADDATDGLGAAEDEAFTFGQV